jgi:hypothetical protein
MILMNKDDQTCVDVNELDEIEMACLRQLSQFAERRCTA